MAAMPRVKGAFLKIQGIFLFKSPNTAHVVSPCRFTTGGGCFRVRALPACLLDYIRLSCYMHACSEHVRLACRMHACTCIYLWQVARTVIVNSMLEPNRALPHMPRQHTVKESWPLNDLKSKYRFCTVDFCLHAEGGWLTCIVISFIFIKRDTMGMSIRTVIGLRYGVMMMMMMNSTMVCNRC